MASSSSHRLAEELHQFGFPVHAPSRRLIAFIAGVLLHVLVFRRGEWDREAARLPALFASAQLIAIACLYSLTAKGENRVHALYESSQEVVLSASVLVVGIYTSMVIYRVFFHRLNRFPGSYWARLSNFYPTYLSAKDLHLCKEVEELHKKYGDFVRLGPSELSIIHPDAITAIHGAQSPCTKGPWYNVFHPRYSLLSTRDKPEHARRRKVWDRGFSSKALRDYEPRVMKYTNQLLERIESSKGQAMNIAEWFNFYTFDVMGDLSFGKSFNMLQDGIKHYFMKVLHEDMTSIGYLSHLMWLFPIFKVTPVLNASNIKFWKWLTLQVEERKKMKPDRPDVFSWLLEEHNATGVGSVQAEMNLGADAYLIVVAGSDTTAEVLTTIVFELSQHQDQIPKLRDELDTYFATTPIPDPATLGKLEHLNAVINEAMRLHPPVPGGTQRQTPKEGLTIGGTYIPGKTIVQIPLHTLFRDERLFLKNDEFIPERWTTRPELNVNTAPFQPFSIGPYSCIGKQLALMEIRYVVSQIISRYDVSLAPGYTPEMFYKNKKDAFTITFDSVEMVFTERKR